MERAKQLLPWDGTTLVEWQVGQLREAGAPDVYVVVGAHADEVRLRAEEAGGMVVENRTYREGRASSLRAGAWAVPDTAEAVVILSVDQPRPAWVTASLLAAWRGSQALLLVPEYGGRRGHPVIAAGSLLPELREVDEASMGLRAVMERHASRTEVAAIQNSCVIVDLNTPVDYQTALHSLEAGDWARPGEGLQTG